MFCSYYFEDHLQTKARTVPRNYEGGGNYFPSDDPLNLSIFKYSGRPLGCSRMRHMSQQEYKATYSYILPNCEEVELYVRLIFYESNFYYILYCLQLDYILTNISKILSNNRITLKCCNISIQT